jgi:sulfite exporter TauE/SafE
MNHFMAVCGSVSLLGAFIAGSAGSMHCLAMCGGLSGALGLRTQRLGASPRRTFGHTLSYQVGRVSSYTMAGALVGTLGASLLTAFDLERLATSMRVLAGVVLVAASVGILSAWRPLASLERLGGRLWTHIAPVARSIPATSTSGSLALGMLWGFLPCGMVYSMLLVATLAGSTAKGAATMLCFGLGTVPAVLAAGLMSARILRLAAGRRLNLVAGSLLLVCGLLTLLAPLSGLSG